MRNFRISAFGAVLLVLWGLAHASAQQEVDAILQRREPPAGVVFEILEKDADALDWAMPEVNRYTEKLRQRFPGLDVAVVAHGNEMFALQSTRRDRNRAVHQAVQRLTKQEGVPVYVCETLAADKGIVAEAFPDYVNVAPAGSAQINDYVTLGYILIKISRH